jgi:hypothetical protein
MKSWMIMCRVWLSEDARDASGCACCGGIFDKQITQSNTGQLLIGAQGDPVIVAAMRASNEDCSPTRIYR